MSKAEFFSVCQYVAYREFDGKFLIFSGFTRDTLIVHPYAFKIVQFVEKKSRSFQDILNFIHEIDYELSPDESSLFVSKTLEKLVDHGVLYFMEK